MKKALLIILSLLFLAGCSLFIQEPVDLTMLNNALLDTSCFKVRFYYEDNQYFYQTDYTYCDKMMSYSYEIDSIITTGYFAYDEEEKLDYYYYQDNKNVWQKVDSTSSTYKNAKELIDYLDLNKIDTSHYTKSLGDYVPKAEFLQEEALNIFRGEELIDNNEVFNYLRIKITNNKIEKIYAESITSEGKYIFVLTFSNWGTANITLPVIPPKTNKEKWQASLPTSGEVNALVVPINFTDYIFTSKQLNNLNKAFNGTSIQTGFESVSTYYKKSSYNQLNLSFTILPAYQTNKSANFYRNKYLNDEYPEDEIMEEVLNYFDPTVDFSLYDADNNGDIDAIYLIYAAPVDYEEKNLWWAWTTNYTTRSPRTYDGKTLAYYVWAGCGFMDDMLSDNGTSYSFDDIYVAANATTYIHETGHLFGLDDYYDYYPEYGPSGGLGGADMMDMAVGDHNPASKYLLEWITPEQIQTSAIQTLRPYNSYGDSLIIYKDEVSAYSEYIIMMFYTPDGLNRLTHGYQGLPSERCIIIYHVDARMNPLIGDPNNEDYSTPFSFNNSTSEHKFIKIVEADSNNSIESTINSIYGEYLTYDDVFHIGDVLENYTWYDGSIVPFKITITNMTANQATITFIKTN